MADADGKVVYKVEMDDSDVDKQLNDVNSKIQQDTKKTADKAKKEVKEVTQEVKDQTSKIEKETKATNDSVQQSVAGLGDKIKSSIGGIGDGIKESVSSIAQPFDDVAGQIGLSFSSLAKAGVVGAIVGIGTAAVNSAMSVEDAMKKFQAQTGTAKDELQGYQDIMEDIYTSNYGDSVMDVADSMAKVKQQIEGISDADLQTVTEGVLTLRDSFEMDFDETLRGTKQLMEQFGISADEALDLMAKGGQEGLDYTHELGDNVAEYVGKFAQAGYSASDYFQLLKNGTQDGAYNLDKVNDAINEVTTRLADGTIEDSLGSFSKETQNTFKAWQDGKATQKDVIDSIVNDIKKCTNEQDKMTLAATAFGTMGEDANTKFIESLSSVGDEFDNVNGTMDDVKETMGSSLSAQFEELMRNIEMVVVPLGEALLPILTMIVSTLGGVMSILAPIFEGVGAFITDVTNFFGSINWSEVIGTQLGYIAESFSNTWEAIKSVGQWFVDTWNGIATWWQELNASIDQALVDTWNGIASWFSSTLSNIVSGAQNILSGLYNWISSIFSNIRGVFQGVIDFIRGTFSGNWSQAWNGIKSIFSNIVSGFANIFKSPINAIISGINGFIRGLNKIKIPSWVPVVGGKGINIPTIPRLKVGMDFVPSDFYPAYLDYGEAVLTKEENAKLRSFGGISGIEQMFNTQSISSDLDIDYEKLASAMAGVSIPIYLDGKLVGYSVTGAVDQNMGIITSRKGRYGI